MTDTMTLYNVCTVAYSCIDPVAAQQAAISEKVKGNLVL